MNMQDRKRVKLKKIIAETWYVGLVTRVCLSEIAHNITDVDID